ncbi:hypothetical protein BJ138DRAFT_1215032 [Hygrophoropsis aurantiaca]|uniref:Uncharacterized protein n=1 Tax=Hygrophoropsis aurantiaca TaxID=72124 RepID=A0ACB8A2E4_9AGAM|nr:hypothetical protein BJ138DRAFT_1215032 [Hygrophoropsis aurantiaca]
MEYTTAFWSALTTPAQINNAGLQLNTVWGNDSPETVTGLILGTACDKPMLIDIPVRPNYAVAVDYWLPLTRGYTDHQPNCAELRTTRIDIFPERLPNDYIYYFFDQSLKKPVNKCIALSAMRPARAVYGDVVVLKRDPFNNVVDMEESDKQIVSSMATA